ncbi:acyltransferase [Sphingobacterium multivorum]|uniref:acyltransferase n=1 Tax=Sphingobacterium multivorum TaxID=28454 RepID=UPI00345EAD3C
MNSKLIYIYNLIRLLIPETSLFKIKNIFLRLCGVKIGDKTRICSSAKIVGNGDLTIGSDTWIGLNVMILSSEGVVVNIGNNVDIAPQVFIGTGSHELNTSGNRVAGKGSSKSIYIGDGTWVGARVVILPGVKIGKMCMIAAGSIVTKNVADYTMVGGVPAKEIKKLI